MRPLILIFLILFCLFENHLAFAGGLIARQKQMQEMKKQQMMQMMQQQQAAYQQAAVQQQQQAAYQQAQMQAAQQMMIQQAMAQRNAAMTKAVIEQAVQQRNQAMAQAVVQARKKAMENAYEQAAYNATVNKAQQQTVMMKQAIAQKQATEIYQQAVVAKTVAARQAVEQQMAQAKMAQSAAAASAIASTSAAAAQGVSAMDSPYANIPADQVKDIVDLTDVWKKLDESSQVWALLIDNQAKVATVDEYIKRFAKQGVKISHSASYYAHSIDQISSQNSSLLTRPFKEILQMVAIVDYDFDNGINKNDLARHILSSDAAYQANKKRLGL